MKIFVNFNKYVSYTKNLLNLCQIFRSFCIIPFTKTRHAVYKKSPAGGLHNIRQLSLHYQSFSIFIIYYQHFVVIRTTF